MLRIHKLFLILALSVLLAGCHGSGGGETDEDRQRLEAIDDSMSVQSPHTREAIAQGMGHAKDSLTYYEYVVRMAKFYCLSATPDSMAPYANAVIRYAGQLPPSPRRNALLAFAYNVKAAYYHNFHKNDDEAVRLYHDAYMLLQHSDAKEQMPDVCANLGDAYLFKNQLPKGAYWYRRALFLADSLDIPKEREVSLYMGLASIYLQLEDFESALMFYRQTERQFDKMSVSMQAYFLNNYGNYYYYVKDYASALDKFLQLEKFLRKHGKTDTFDIYLCWLNMADVYLNLGKPAQAELCLDKVEPFMRKNGDALALYYCNTIRIGLAVWGGKMNTVSQILASEEQPGYVAFSLRQVRNRYLREYYVAKGDYRSAYQILTEDIAKNDSLEHNLINMRASEVTERFAQDTIRLHHRIAMEHKNAEIASTRSAFFAAAVVAMALLVLIVFVVMRSHKRKEQAKMAMMRLRLANVRNRISPHFIFNVLNNKIVTSGSQEAGELMLLAKLIRANLDMSCQMEVSLCEELDFVRRYVEVESRILGDDFEFRMDVASGVDVAVVRIPSMFVQILVENAIVHGLRGWDGHKLLHVLITEEGERAVRISVRDNGPGFDARNLYGSQRTGLNIIRQTVAMVNERNKEKMTFQLHNMTNVEGTTEGCEGILVIPKKMRLW